MTKDVWIKVSGLQFTGENADPEPVEIITSGTYTEKNGKHYLRYEEYMPDESGFTTNTVVIDPDSVDILKKGAASTSMFFHRDQKTFSIYSTPFGNLVLGLDTQGIDIDAREDSLAVLVKYGLELNSQFVADCSISITANEKNSGNIHI